MTAIAKFAERLQQVSLEVYEKIKENVILLTCFFFSHFGHVRCLM